MKSKAPIKRTPFFMAALLLLLFFLLLLGAGVFLPPVFCETYPAALQDKIAYLRSREGKRLILIGGSSVPFAVNSELIENEFPEYSVVDLGLYAEMGNTVLLDLVRQELREEDLVILMPEQTELSYSDAVDGETLLQACDGQLTLLQNVKTDKWAVIAAAYPVYAAKKIRYTLEGGVKVEGIWARASFNEQGDIAYASREQNILPGGVDSNTQIRFDTALLQMGFVREANQLCEAAEAVGARVLWHFAPMNAGAIGQETEKSTIDAFYAALLSTLHFDILGSPHDCVMDAGWFYDSNFHLNASGAVVFTERLIRDIKVYMNDPSQTAIALPALPQLAAVRVEGSNEDESCFLYEAVEGGYKISALSLEGTQRKSLVVPVSYNGEPVVEIDEAVFKNNMILQQVTIQENIRLLPDHLFDGSTSFARLQLTQVSPALCVPGDELLETRPFEIWVPTDSLESYRFSYYWQKYTAYLCADEK